MRHEDVGCMQIVSPQRDFRTFPFSSGARRKDSGPRGEPGAWEASPQGSETPRGLVVSPLREGVRVLRVSPGQRRQRWCGQFLSELRRSCKCHLQFRNQGHLAPLSRACSNCQSRPVKQNSNQVLGAVLVRSLPGGQWWRAYRWYA